MKKTIFTFLLITLVSFFSSNQLSAQSEGTPLELEVKGMTCKGCVYKVKQSLKEIKGVVSTESVTLETGKVLINYDPSIASKDAIAKNLAKLCGYSVSVSSTSDGFKEATKDATGKADCSSNAKCTKSKEECAKAKAAGKSCCSSTSQKECEKSKK